MNEQSAIAETLRNLTIELRELDIGDSVPRVSSISAVEFLGDYVSSNKPVVLIGGFHHWPALTRWTREYLIDAAGDTLVTVSLTPNGRADCPTPLPPQLARKEGSVESIACSHCFALPCQRRTLLSTFFNLLDASRTSPDAAVPYMQYQNSSLTAELPQLLPDVEAELPWASEAFGGPPEAVNLWIGGSRTITSWHKDPFENIYCIVKGRKSFRLLPPTDSYRMGLRKYPLATWELEATAAQDSTHSTEAKEGIEVEEEVRNGTFRLELDKQGGKVLWSSVLPEPLESDSEKEIRNNTGDSDLYHDPRLPKPLVVTLEPGEALYLPSYWWHEVHHHSGGEDKQLESQEQGDDDVAIAVNYWYDMRMDMKYAYAKAVEALAVAAGLNEPELSFEESESSSGGDEEGHNM